MEIRTNSEKDSTIYTYKDFIFGSILTFLALKFIWEFAFVSSRQEYFNSEEFFLPPADVHMGLMIALYMVWTFVNHRQNKPNKGN